MSNINQSIHANGSSHTSPTCAAFDGFDGINTAKAHAGFPSTGDIENFRITDDGSLVKRCGFRLIASANAAIRGVWSGMIGGHYEGYLLAASQVCRIDLATETLSLIGTVESGTGNANFFFYHDRLYLSDGIRVYEITQNSVQRAKGYVPLVGKDWISTYVGKKHEELNRLTRRARITYDMNLESLYPSVVLRLGGPAESVEAVYKNGNLLSTNDYHYDNNVESVVLHEVKETDRFEIFFTYAESVFPETSETLPAKGAEVFSGIHTGRVFFRDSERGNLLRCSSYVPMENLQEARRGFPDCGDLYVPFHHEFTVGDGRYDIRGAVRHYDRLLIMTDGDTWMASDSSAELDNFPVLNINAAVGCASDCGIGIAGNSPVSVGHGKIYRWTAETDEMNDCNAYSISDPIDSFPDEDFYQNAVVYSNRRRNEVWFYDGKENGNILIYRVSDGKWFRYSGFSIDRFFDLPDGIGFYSGKDLYRFDEDCNVDCFADGTEREITARFCSNLLDFGSHTIKRLSSLCFCGDCDSGILKCVIRYDDRNECTAVIEESGNHHTLIRRLHAGRFRYATLTLTAPGSARQVVHSVGISVR